MSELCPTCRSDQPHKHPVLVTKEVARIMFCADPFHDPKKDKE